MGLEYITKPAYLSGVNPKAVYVCPAAKRAYIKSINATNENFEPCYVSVIWNDTNNTVGGTSVFYSVLISGLVSGYKKMRILDDYLVVKAGDSIIASGQAFSSSSNAYISLFVSAIERDV